MTRKFILFCLLGILFNGCANEVKRKQLSIFLESGGVIRISKRHVVIHLDNKSVIDTIINNRDLHTDQANIIRCVDFDPRIQSNLQIQINSCAIEIDLNKYKEKCINIHAVYDDLTIMKNIVKKANEEHTQKTGKGLNVNRFVDSLLHVSPDLKLDTAFYITDLKTCPCK